MIELLISKPGKRHASPAPFWMQLVTTLLFIVDSTMALVVLTKPGF